MLRATTEFCWMGIRYKSGDEVAVPKEQAAQLAESWLVKGDWAPVPAAKAAAQDEPKDAGDNTPKAKKSAKGK